MTAECNQFVFGFHPQKRREIRAQCSTIRLKVWKIGALIRITVRQVWVSLAGGYPPCRAVPASP